MASKLDEVITAVAVTPEVPDSDKYFSATAAAARELGSAKIGDLIRRLTAAPKVTAKNAGVPQFRDGWGRMWNQAILNILCETGEQAVQPLLDLIEPFRPIPYCNHEYVTAALVRLAATTDAKDDILRCLRKVLPQVHRTIVRSAVFEIGMRRERFSKAWSTLEEHGDLTIVEAARNRRQSEVAAKMLKSLGLDDLAVDDDDEENRATTIRTFMDEVLHEERVAAEHAARRPPVPPPPEEHGPWKNVAKRFAETIVNRDFAATRDLFAPELRKKYTAKGIEKLVKEWTQHSGWPDAFEIGGNDIGLADLRQHTDPSFGPLPEFVNDENFRKWVCVQFLPKEESAVDACFDWWMALIESGGALKIGYFEIVDPD